jgi:hypothetical protein
LGNVSTVGVNVKNDLLSIVVKDLTYCESIFTETLSPSESKGSGS